MVFKSSLGASLVSIASFTKRLLTRRGAVVVLSLGLWFASEPTAAAQPWCRLPADPVISMSAVIGQGGYLSSDTRGAYVDGTQTSSVTVDWRANLLPTVGAVKPNSRYVVFNFNSPAPGDPIALPLGIVQDPLAEIRVLNALSPIEADGNRTVHGIQELPDDGTFHVMERTDLTLTINNTPHLLIFGGDAFPKNICRQDQGAVFDAPGSTKVQVARVGD